MPAFDSPALEHRRAAIFEQLLQACRSGRVANEARPAALPSGFAQLDAILPGGGWPMGSVTELMPDTAGLGELGLILPALSRLTQSGRYLGWIEPPYLPYATALAQHGVRLERCLLIRTQALQQSLWAAEQALRCPAFGAVLAWPAQILDKQVRRLQLAAEAGASLGILYRPAAAAHAPSPAALRLCLHAHQDGLEIELHKARGSGQLSRRRCTIAPQAA